MSIETLTDANFAQQVEKAKGVVLVDFWAPWCMPCLLVSPVIEHVAESFKGRVTVGKLNVDQNSATSVRYHIQGIPTVAIFRDGTLVATVVGARPEHTYVRLIDDVLAGKAARTA